MIAINKIKTLIVSALLLISISTVYANIDAASLITSWYQNSFKDEAKIIKEISYKKVQSGIDALGEFQEETQQDTIEALTSFGKTTSINAQDAVKNYQFHYLDRLEITKNQLANQNAFDEYKGQAIEQSEREINEDVTNILSEVLAN